jgi:hypothetical protein
VCVGVELVVLLLRVSSKRRQAFSKSTEPPPLVHSTYYTYTHNTHTQHTHTTHNTHTHIHNTHTHTQGAQVMTARDTLAQKDVHAQESSVLT